jgi:enterochelin esterase-like enzyme
MILHSEVNQNGMLQTYLPHWKGQRVVLSVVLDTHQDTGSNWANITTVLQQVDQLTSNQQRHIDDILADLRSFRETQ